MFRVGQKVICISAFTSSWVGTPYAWPSHIVSGGVYTVRDVDARLPGHLLLRLDEYLAPVIPHIVFGEWELAFLASCFRPVVEKTTDISVFTEMLTPLRPRVLETI